MGITRGCRTTHSSQNLHSDRNNIILCSYGAPDDALRGRRWQKLACRMPHTKNTLSAKKSNSKSLSL